MAAVTERQILDALARVRDPDKGSDIVSLNMVSGVVIRDGNVGFAIEVEPERGPRLEPLRKAAEEAVEALPGVLSVTAVLTAESRSSGRQSPGAQRPPPHAHAHGNAPQGPGAPAAQATRRGAVPGVGAIVAVASGKGGVGKSTTAVNLALALHELGLKVGILDADIYGPSMPKLLGIRERPESAGGNRLRPIERYGMPVMSIGFLIEEETPMIWRGPMVMSALTQMLREVEWGTLDVLVVDMPPGTGDAQLTMAQQVPLKGAVIVSTPQDLALIDARRGIAMFRRVNVPVLGIVENMSTFICPHCGSRSDIFGHGGARREADRLGVPFLGEVPLDIAIREKSDAGSPVVSAAADNPLAQYYRDIAVRVRDGLAAAGRPAPKIVIEA